MNAGGCAIVHSGTVIDPSQRRVPARDIVICHGTISTRCTHDPVHIDANEGFVCPGLVDLHLHGALGHDFTESDPDVWQNILNTHLRAGTTSAMATLASTTPSATAAALSTAAELMTDQLAPSLIGVHLEGPALAPEHRGAHDPRHLRTPIDLISELTPIPAALRMVTLAPELHGADELITYLANRNVRIAAGHSGATVEQLARAQQLGLSHIAHLWSGQTTMTRPELHRQPGLLEASLASNGLTAEVIADGHHLPPAFLTIALRCLGTQRLCLVSDATAGTGLPTGSTFRTGSTVGQVHTGFAATADHTSLCGSVVPLSTGIARMRQLTGTGIEEVLTMATATPARVAGMYPQKGSLAPGTDGDVVVLERDLAVRHVMINGWVLAADDSERVQ